MSSRVKERHVLWVLVTRADDLQDAWIARVLELGLTTQADSVQEAFEMAADAIRLAVFSDLEKGLDPFARRPSAEEHWRTLEKIIKNPRRLRLEDLSDEQRRNKLRAVATQFSVALEEVMFEGSDRDSAREPYRVPVMLEPWQIAHLEQLRESCLPS